MVCLGVCAFFEEKVKLFLLFPEGGVSEASERVGIHPWFNTRLVFLAHSQSSSVSYFLSCLSLLEANSVILILTQLPYEGCLEGFLEGFEPCLPLTVDKLW